MADRRAHHAEEMMEQEHEDSIPHTRDPERLFLAKKARLMARVVPMTLVPLSSANGMLVIGSGLKNHDKKKDCFFPLMQYLLICGSISLSLVVLAVAAKHMIEWILFDKVVTRTGEILLRALRWLGLLLALFQLVIIVAGSIIVFPNFAMISYNPKDKYYCSEGAVVFTMFILIMCWIFAAFALVCYVYIHCVEGKRQRHHDLAGKMFVNPGQERRQDGRGVSERARSRARDRRNMLMGAVTDDEDSTDLESGSTPRRNPPTYQESVAKNK